MDKDFLQALFWRLGTEDGDIPEDAISEVPPTPPNSHLIEHFDECVRYKGIESYAKYFVESLLKEANRYCEIKIVSGLEEARRPRWPSIEEFTVDLGSTTIHVYLNTFELIEDWLFCVNYIFAQSDEVSDFYYYEAKWGLPTNAYPIPQATCSLYFTIEVSRVQPNHCPVDVTFQCEGSRSIWKPGEVQFQEHWLSTVVDQKIRLFRSVTF